MNLWDPNHSPEAKAAIEHWHWVRIFSELREDNLEDIAHSCDRYWDGWGWTKPRIEDAQAQADLAARILAWRRQGTDGPFR